MATTLVRFNVNENVRVRLTETGLAIHRMDHALFVASLQTGIGGESVRVYRPPKIDADGFWTTQAWHLMQLFGSHMYLGRNPPFHTDIELVVPR